MTYTVKLLFLSARRRNFFLREIRAAGFARGIVVFIVGCDVDGLDPFLKECDVVEKLPPKRDIEWDARVCSLVQRYEPDLIFGWNDEEILRLVNIDSLSSRAVLALPSRDIVTLMCDKVNTHKWLIEHGFKSPRVIEMKEPKKSGAVVVKPRYGQGGLGVYVCRSPATLVAATESQSSEYIIQEYVSGNEYTTDVVAFEGRCIVSLPRRRIKVRGGEVMIAQVELREDIAHLAERLCAELSVTGIFNFQAIDSDSGLVLIEMNPRFGGGSDLTIAAGVDIAGAYLDIFIHKIAPPTPLVVRDRLIMTRRFVSEFIEGSQLLWS